MILTVTMNPSVDISYPIETFIEDQVNRCQNPQKTAGGKGLNVTRVIHQMNESVIATGLLGGVLGTFIEEKLDEQGISHHFSKIKGETRNCIAILHDKGKQTEILEGGPTVTTEELKIFEDIFLTEAQKAKVVTISGSLPKGAPEEHYVNIIEVLKEAETKIILDTSGNSLKEVLNAPFKPYAIKPNLEELGELTGDEIELDVAALKEVLSRELFDDISLILVSLGKDGAFVKHQNDFYQARIPKINVVNPVGSGDSTVAGLAIALKNNLAIEEIIKTAMTLGILNTLESKTGYVNPENFSAYLKKINVEKV